MTTTRWTYKQEQGRVRLAESPSSFICEIHDDAIGEQICAEHNAHAALVEALEQIIALEGTGKRGVPVIRRVNRMTDIAKAALALAKGE